MGSKTTKREILRDAMRLSIPVMLEEALGTAVQYVDSAMVGRLGASASAAVGMTSSVSWLVNSPIWAMGVAVMAVIARNEGAGNHGKARRAAGQALWMAVMIGIVIGAFTFAISPHLPGWMGAEASLHSDASAYFRIICLPMIFRAFLFLFGFVFRAMHEVRFPMVVNIGVNLLNVVLDRLMIFGPMEMTLAGVSFSLPGFGWGVRGAAVATALSYSAGGLVMLIALLTHPAVGIKKPQLRLDKGILKEFFRIGLPASLTRIGTCLGHVVFASQVTRLGTTALAAHTLAITAEEAFYIPGYGMQTAVATLCGNALGAGDERRLKDTAAVMSMASGLLMAVTGIILFLIPERMMGIFTRDSAVIALGASVLRLVAVSEPVYGVGIILDGVFDGIGDTRTPLRCSVSTMWGIRILFTWICVNILGLGLMAVWVCMVANNVSKTLLEGMIFLSGSWKKRIGLTAEET
ncbi:MAG: MATE family efflux transporter [Clostridia bacterium]|nr:MATE family efflux transporter [Clostridia bacterium]